MFYYTSTRDLIAAANVAEDRNAVIAALRRTDDQGRRWLTVNAVARNHRLMPFTQQWLRIAAIMAAGAQTITEDVRAWARLELHLEASAIRTTEYTAINAVLYHTSKCLAPSMTVDAVMEAIDEGLEWRVKHDLGQVMPREDEVDAAHVAAKAAEQASHQAHREARRLAARARGRAPIAVQSADAHAAALTAEFHAAHAAGDTIWSQHNAAKYAAQQQAIAYARNEWSRLRVLTERLAERFPLVVERAPVSVVGSIPYAGQWDGATSFHRSICCGNYWFGAEVGGSCVPVRVTLADANDDLRRIERDGWLSVGVGGVNIHTYARHKTRDTHVPPGGVWVTTVPADNLRWNVVSFEPRSEPETSGCVDSLGRW